MNELFKIEGFVKILDATSGEILVDKKNSINYENFSLAIANSIIAGPLNVNTSTGLFYSMAFGNGGTQVSSTGIITYNPPNNIGTNADLYNQTYSKVINNNFSANVDPTNNNVTVEHTTGKLYSDILISCRLDYGEPSDQQAFDNTVSLSDKYVFDELGIKSTTGQLLTHVTFNPLEKSLNRLIQVYYTVRIQTAASLV